MNKALTIVLLFSICVTALVGCFSSTRIYKKEYEKNDLIFVQRDVGTEVFVRVNDDEEYTGELLTVNDSIMFLSFEEGLTEQELISSTDQVYTIQNLNIKSMWIYGEDKHLIGLVIGVGLGLAIMKIAANQPKRNDALLIGSIGLLTAVTGIIAGAAASTYDEEIYNYKNATDFDFMQLNIYSRYGGKEPDYLKEIK
jgi:hypothetical protein